MKKIFIISIVSACMLMIAKTSAAQERGTLSINANNFESSTGKAVANLFREQDDIPKHPFKTTNMTIIDGKATLAFKDLPHGSYAVIVYHDENENGTLDHKFGFPNEAMGFSNGWDLSLFSGMPTFQKLKITHTHPETTIEVKVD
jgi:uncharacterized protein (DUF2141 family)